MFKLLITKLIRKNGEASKEYCSCLNAYTCVNRLKFCIVFHSQFEIVNEKSKYLHC